MDEEIKLYQSEDALVKLEVRIEKDTIWLTQKQIGILFGVQKAAISKHLKNIFESGELNPQSVVSKMETTAADGKTYEVRYYNLDAILSIGYRVNSVNATRFRIWANQILKEYILRGAAVNQRIELIEHRMSQAEQGLLSVNQKVDKMLQQTLPPTHGIFFDGQIFDAYQFVSDLIRSAKRSIVLFDNYADDSVLTQLAKRTEGVAATVCASRISEGLRLDVKRHNAQYAPIGLREVPAVHDRFLLIDDTILYTFGASFKDLGKKMFCFNKMESEDVIEAVRNALHNIDFDY
ncbi:MAG: virulence RhuM family protein [Bacteroidales bacterium]|nr:virulence RhuM family protein [Bacteroidales bacterium]